MTSQNGPAAADEKAAWRRLYEAALELRDAEPWQWMREDDVFGFLDPESGELELGCVLGGEEEEGSKASRGFALYRGLEGMRFLYRHEDDPGLPGDPDTPMWEDAVIVEYVGRRHLTDADWAQWEWLGFGLPSKHKSRRFPRFRSHKPAHLPWPLVAEEVALLTTGLQLARGFVELVEQNPDFYGDRPFDEVPVYKRVGTASEAPWRLEWTQLDLEAGAAVVVVPPDEPEVLAATALPLGDEEWEVGAHFSPKPVTGPGRPFHPRATFVVEAAGGTMFACEASPPVSHEEMAAAHALFAVAIPEAGRRPHAVVVDSPRLAEALGPALEAAGIRLRYRRRLPALERVIEHFEERFRPEAGGEAAG